MREPLSLGFFLYGDGRLGGEGPYHWTDFFKLLDRCHLEAQKNYPDYLVQAVKVEYNPAYWEYSVEIVIE